MKKTVVLLLLAISATAAYPQSPHESFEEFKRGIMKDFNDFKGRILQHYSDFLNGEWHEYESLKGVKRDNTPKPKTAPRLEKTPKRETPEADKPVTDTPVASAPGADKLTDKPGGDRGTDKPEPRRPEVRPGGRVEMDTADTPKMPDEETFDFYGIDLPLPRIEFNIARSVRSKGDFAESWRMLESQKAASKVVPHIKDLAKRLGLNDYLTYELTAAYLDSKFPGADEASKMSAVHHLLANMGYDVRIGVTNTGSPILLIPFEQMVYGRTFVELGGKRYFVFTPPGVRLDVNSVRFSTCDLPNNADLGRPMDLRLGTLNLPEKPKEFNITDGELVLKGSVNENMMKMLYRYPQMPTEDYAVSILSPGLRDDLVAQLKRQLGGKSEKEAVDKLLKLIHIGLPYATDDDFHGFEKPYFLEETLYYPKCDCEDRAILFTYLAWNALGLENQLIAYPGHEAAAVALKDDVEGTSYTYNGRRFYISDPTYIGAGAGECMPSFQHTAPKIDLYYR